jgi:succinate-semialdehyde dehydrogenase/glutarate-semialdehyde dehydrogenase
LEDRKVRGFKFIGSHYNGSILAEKCGKQMKKATFELGSNDAFIVLNDA